MTSHPAWGEWIEIGRLDRLCRNAESHPAWGEWIEIPVQTGSPPTVPSHPAWGEWIEMSLLSSMLISKRSHPAWGEWIEIAPGRAKTRQGSPTSYGQQKYCAITAFVKSHIKYLTNMNQCAIIIAL